MISADIRGKYSSQEDRLTSVCFDLIRFLPDRFLIAFLQQARDLRGNLLALSNIDTVDELALWPWLPRGGEPDALISLRGQNGQSLRVVVEAKFGSGKSQGEEDQLARYSNAAADLFKEDYGGLIYVTAHRSIPHAELQESEAAIGHDLGLYWLSWFFLTGLCDEELARQTKAEGTEFRILKRLRDYLGIRGLDRFTCWPRFPDRLSQQLVGGYRRAYTGMTPIEANLPFCHADHREPPCKSWTYKKHYLQLATPNALPLEQTYRTQNS